VALKSSRNNSRTAAETDTILAHFSSLLQIKLSGDRLKLRNVGFPELPGGNNF
jgi:hypothetical protein